MRRRPRIRASAPAVLVLVPVLVAVGTGVAWATWTATTANPASTISANSDITAPTVTAATAVRTASPQAVQHVTQGASYRLYAAASDGGGPASGVSTVRADLSAITSGQTAVSLTAGNAASVGGVSYGYGTGALTAASSLPLCRYAVPVTATDVAGNSSTFDQQVMVDRTLDANTYRTRIDGASAGDSLGWVQLAGMGDLNGDGRKDYAVSSQNADHNGRTDSGSTWVVFGRSGAGTIDLASLGTGGYRIDGATAGEQSGWEVFNVGDVNGDGVEDLLTNAPYADNNARANSGSAYVVFGKSTTSAVDLSSLGSQGFRIDGATAGDLLGYSSVGAAGDVNGDGRADLILSSTEADNTSRTDSGSAYVVFGKATTGTVDLAALGSEGFRIDGAATGDRLGNIVAGAGDLNADGRSDVLVTAKYTDNNSRADSGSVYVVFGKATTGTVDVASLGTSGYRIDGAQASDNLGSHVTAAGDVNGDGTSDLFVTARSATRNGRSASGIAYVVWGKSTTTTQDLASLGTGGYQIDGAAAGDEIGRWGVVNLGDVNGDGVPDQVIAASDASTMSGTYGGVVYVLFGKTTTTTIDLASLGSQGFRYEGTGGEVAGRGLASAGDVDGDGVNDLLVGAPNADNNSRTDSGSVYVVPTPTCSYKQAVLQTSGLKSYWRLNATSGTLAADSKGSVSCWSYGPYTPGVPGALSDGDRAASFATGGAQWCNDVYDFAGITPFSVEAWIKVSTPALDGNFHRIVSKESPGAGGLVQGWDLELTPSGGYPGISGFANRFKVNRWQNAVGAGVVTTSGIAPGRWYHVVMTTDASTTNIYVNGQLAGTAATTNSIVDGSSGLLIGSGSASAAIDEVAIYDVALTQTQVQQHYALR